MPEDPSQSPGEPEASEQPQGQPEAAALAKKAQVEPEATILASSSQGQSEATILAHEQEVDGLVSKPSYPSTPEVYIQPEAVTSTPSAQSQYPPLPDFYAQQPERPPQLQQPGQQPRMQNPYATPAAGYGAPQMGYRAPTFPPPPVYGYEPFPQVKPLPLGQAVRELPGQYWKILRKPGPRSFAEEQGKAEWGIIWIQLLFLMLFQAITALPIGIMEQSAINNALTSSGSTARLDISTSAFVVMITIGVIVFAPLVFFATVGIQWLLAKAFKGTGWFKQQAYNQLLFQVPIIFITALLYLLITPFLRDFASFTSLTGTSMPTVNPLSLVIVLLVSSIGSVLGIYGIVLNVFSIMAAQRLSGGRATGVVLIPYAVLFVLYFGCVCAGVLISISAGLQPGP